MRKVLQGRAEVVEIEREEMVIARKEERWLIGFSEIMTPMDGSAPISQSSASLASVTIPTFE